jgi:hypothetical protein
VQIHYRTRVEHECVSKCDGCASEGNVRGVVVARNSRDGYRCTVLAWGRYRLRRRVRWSGAVVCARVPDFGIVIIDPGLLLKHGSAHRHGRGAQVVRAGSSHGCGVSCATIGRACLGSQQGTAVSYHQEQCHEGKYEPRCSGLSSGPARLFLHQLSRIYTDCYCRDYRSIMLCLSSPRGIGPATHKESRHLTTSCIIHCRFTW